MITAPSKDPSFPILKFELPLEAVFITWRIGKGESPNSSWKKRGLPGAKKPILALTIIVQATILERDVAIEDYMPDFAVGAVTI